MDSVGEARNASSLGGSLCFGLQLTAHAWSSAGKFSVSAEIVTPSCPAPAPKVSPLPRGCLSLTQTAGSPLKLAEKHRKLSPSGAPESQPRVQTSGLLTVREQMSAYSSQRVCHSEL